jgi:hypothetical protein
MATVEITKASPREVGGSSCGTHYEGTIIRDLHGRHNGKQIAFGRTTGLNPGQSIRGVFVWFNGANEFAVLVPKSVQQDSSGPAIESEDLFVCGDLLPGYILFTCVEGEGDKDCAMRGERIAGSIAKPRS